MADLMKRAAVLGASGYTGVEAVRLIMAHPRLKLVALTGHSKAGQPYGTIYPSLSHLNLPDVVTADEVNWDEIDVVFACLPHGASQDTIAKIAGRVETIIDLSADFRLSDPELYAKTYGRSHDHADLLKGAVYGLTEFARGELAGASLVACPGCYPTCSLLALLPALDAGLIDPSRIIIDAKSGVTGAGRKASLGVAYSEVADGAHAYGVGTHRHAPEIDQIIARHTPAGTNAAVTFTPHLIPMNRGMIATCYVELSAGVSAQDVHGVYAARYADEHFVHVEAFGVAPQTRHIRATNYARIGVFADRVQGRAIIISVIDNLTKGSSGQAIQNYNVIQGWDESLGLTGQAIFP